MFYKKLENVPVSWFTNLIEFWKGYSSYYLSFKKQPTKLDYRTIEELIADGTGGKHVACGNAPIDVVFERTGIDVKQVTAKGRQTGESSLLQNFKKEGCDLDSDFKDEMYQDIADGFADGLRSKLENAMQDYDLEKIIHLWIVYNETNISYVAFELELDALGLVTYNSVTKSSIFLDNILDESYGNCKIYKPKKRIEVRLNTGIKMQSIITI